MASEQVSGSSLSDTDNPTGASTETEIRPVIAVNNIILRIILRIIGMFCWNNRQPLWEFENRIMGNILGIIGSGLIVIVLTMCVGVCVCVCVCVCAAGCCRCRC